MKNYILTIISVLLINFLSIAQAPDFQWAVQIGGYSWDEGYSSVVSADGSIINVGGFQGVVDFDPGSGVTNLSATANDLFIQKLDVSGNLLWVKTITGNVNEIGKSVTIDDNGNILILGTFYQTVDFNPDTGVFNLTSVGYDDMFVLKLNSEGEFIWAVSYGQVQPGGNPITIKTDGNGNVFTSGAFNRSIDFDPGIGTFIINPGGTGTNVHRFIQKLDSNGLFIWAKSIKVNNAAYSDMYVSIVGEIFLTGSFVGNVDFDPGAGTYVLNSGSKWFSYIEKLDSNGAFLWVKQITNNGGLGNNHSQGITVDNNGNILVNAQFTEQVDLDPDVGTFVLTSAGQTDCFIVKLSPSGTFIWGKQITGTSVVEGGKMITDDSNNVIIVGLFYGTVDFDPSINNYILSNPGLSNTFVEKLDSLGNFEWVNTFVGGINSPSTIGLYGNSNVYITGVFENIVDFDPSVGTNNITSNGSKDVYVVKLGSCESYTTDLILACDSVTWINGITYTSSNNTAKDTLINVAGCDSIISLDLTVNYSNSVNDVIIACDSFTWINGVTYISSNNTAKDTLTNSVGCDSIITLDLTINYTSTSIDVITTCDSLTWIDGITYTTSNNTATDTLINTSGCDSIVTLDLTINYSSTSIIFESACDSYTSPSGNLLTFTGTYIDTIPNSSGCDSLITINLIVSQSSSDTISPIVCDSYTSPSGNNIWTISGTYYDTVFNSNGCDSIITIDLTVNHSTTSSITESECTSYTAPDGSVYTSSGQYLSTIQNSTGCDSNITINLTISSIDSTVTVNGFVLTSNQVGASYQWYNCEGMTLISGATNQTYTPQASGNYMVQVTDGDCKATSDCELVLGVGVEDMTKATNIKLYPNPTNGILIIDKGTNLGLRIEVINGSGGIILTTNSIDQTTTVDLSNYPSGVYLIKLTSENGTAVETVIKR